MKPLALLLAASCALNAQAHFIFLELPPEAPDTAHMRFSEEPLEETDAELQEKSAPMAVTLSDGTPVTYTPGEKARVATVPADTQFLKGSLDYGIMSRGGEYLLVYHAKAVRSVEGAGTVAGLPVEVLAEVKDGTLAVTVLSNGKPAEGAELVVNLPTVKKQAETTTNAAGQASFPIVPGGWVGIRAKVQESKDGTFGDKPYTEVRSYSTLTFPYLAK